MKATVFATGHLMNNAKVRKNEGDRIMISAVLIENHSYFKDEKKIEIVTRIPFCMWLHKESKLPAQLVQGQGIAINGSLYNSINKDTGKPGFNVSISVDSSDLKLFGKRPENKTAPVEEKPAATASKRRNSSKKTVETQDLSSANHEEQHEAVV